MGQLAVTCLSEIEARAEKDRQGVESVVCPEWQAAASDRDWLLGRLRETQEAIETARDILVRVAEALPALEKP